MSQHKKSAVVILQNILFLPWPDFQDIKHDEIPG